MGFGNSSATADALLKEYYTDDEVEMALYEDHPLLGLIQKNNKAKVTGREYVQPIVWGAGQTASATFSVAQAMSVLTGNLPSAYKVPLVEDHSVATLSTQLIKQSETDEGAFMEEATLIVNEQLSNMTRRLSRQAWRGSTGALGQIGTIGNGISTNTRITMANTRDIVNIEVGMQLDLAATDGGSKLGYGTNGHGLFVISVDADQGFFDVGTTPVPYTGSNSCAVTDSANGIPSAASTNFIYGAGDLNLMMHGIADWIPATVLSTDNYCGVNRFQHRVRLAGHYVNGTVSNTVGAAIMIGAARIKNHGGKATHAFVDPIRFAQLQLEQEDKRRLVDVKSTNSVIGYDGIEVATSAGRITVLADMDCPSDTMYILNIDDWVLLSVGQPVGIWKEDGLSWLRSSNQSGMEARFYGFRGLTCRNPRNNARVQLVSSN
jgi:hypothetical protein